MDDPQTTISLLLTPLHQLNAVLEENISVLVAEALCLIGHFPCVVLDSEPCSKSHIVLLAWKLYSLQFLGGGGGEGGREGERRREGDREGRERGREGPGRERGREREEGEGRREGRERE